ncbi:hypothetical protein K239x_22220 [Planctomycetes bacterium K23_9]|uniref:Chromosome partition protein Smc n=2 Tax=Stieleria marina TaxID=1930275 RepID=A0A517NT21_9BACT|nr:hypothetical protein K239x_22220 [Planctomycetes bacterium K23_9]
MTIVDRFRTGRRSALCVAIFALLCSQTFAHEPIDSPASDTPSRGRVVMEKIDSFQTSVRQKLKNVLIRDKDVSTTVETAQPLVPRSSRYQVIHMAGSRRNRRDETLTQGASQARSEVRDQPRAGHQWIAVDSDVDPIQYREILEPTSDSLPPAIPSMDRHSQIPSLPEPLRPISRRPITGDDGINAGGGYPTELTHRYVPGEGLIPPTGSLGQPGVASQGPVVSGSRLGYAQITATEKALALMHENEQLRNAKKNIAGDNERLRESLKSTQDLLARTNDAVRAAQIQLQNAENANRRLREQVAQAESKHKRYLMETDRMLTSLRDELDEVLVSEINQRGN